MKRFVFAATVCAALVLMAGATASLRSTAARKPNLVLRFFDRETTFRASWSENRRPQEGDQIWFHDEIYRWNGGKPGRHVGHANVAGVFLAGEVLRITAVATLPGGTIAVLGDTSGNGPIDTFIVAGGTGRYAGATGELKVRNLGGENSNHSAITIRLWS